jgi:hypothetical protein
LNGSSDSGVGTNATSGTGIGSGSVGSTNLNTNTGVGANANTGVGTSPNAGINGLNRMNDQLGQSPDLNKPAGDNPAVNPSINTR